MGPSSGRWVCQRCYESNEADATACTRCGLERGADPSGADAAGSTPAGAQWAPPVAKQDSRPVWLSLLLRFGWVGVIIVIALVGVVLNARRDDSGQITAGGTLQVSDLRIGDCFDFKDPEADEVDEVQGQPCTAPHGYELMHTFNMLGDAYPNDAEFDTQVGAECLPAFEAYVGTDYDSSVLVLGPLTPTEELWGSGDHSVQCVISDPNDAQLTSSLKGAAR